MCYHENVNVTVQRNITSKISLTLYIYKLQRHSLYDEEKITIYIILIKIKDIYVQKGQEYKEMRYFLFYTLKI